MPPANGSNAERAPRGDGGGDAGAVGATGSEIFGELGVPGAGRLRDSTLRGHTLLDRATPIITLVRFHRSPP